MYYNTRVGAAVPLYGAWSEPDGPAPNAVAAATVSIHTGRQVFPFSKVPCIQNYISIWFIP